MLDYVVRARDRMNVRRASLLEGAAVPVRVDFGPWAEDNGAITSVTWAVKSGNCAVSGQALASNVASAVLTVADQGVSMIEVLASGATHTMPFRLSVHARDPSLYPLGDYWAGN